MVDTMQVAGFVVLAIAALAFLVCALLVGAMLVFEARDHRKRQAAKEARIDAHEARTAERHARQALYVPAHWERRVEDRKAA